MLCFFGALAHFNPRANHFDTAIIMRPLIVILLFTTLGCTNAPQPRGAGMPTTQPGTNAPLPSSGDVHDYIDYALKKHPKLRTQHARWLEQRAHIEATSKWPDPVLKYTFAPLPIETRLGPQHHIVQINQAIPWPSRLKANTHAQNALARAEQIQFDAMFLAIQHSIQTHYWTLWALHATHTTITHQIKVIQTLEQSIKASVQTNIQPTLALHQVAQLRTALQDVLETLKSQQQVHTHQFLAAIGTNTLGKNIIPTGKPMVPEQLPELPKLLKSSEQHPNLVRFQHLLKAQQHKREQAQLQQRPTFILGAQWSLIGEDHSVHNTNHAGRDALMISVGVSIPLWSSANRAAVDVEEARLIQTQATLEMAKLEHQHKIITTHTMLKDVQRRLKLIDTTRMKQAQTNYQLNLAAYSTQKVGIASVIDALKRLFAIERARNELMAKGELLWCQLNILAGQPLHHGGKP